MRLPRERHAGLYVEQPHDVVEVWPDPEGSHLSDGFATSCAELPPRQAEPTPTYAAVLDYCARSDRTNPYVTYLVSKGTTTTSCGDVPTLLHGLEELQTNVPAPVEVVLKDAAAGVERRQSAGVCSGVARVRRFDPER